MDLSPAAVSNRRLASGGEFTYPSGARTEDPVLASSVYRELVICLRQILPPGSDFIASGGF
jgi:hypothetical protein